MFNVKNMINVLADYKDHKQVLEQTGVILVCIVGMSSNIVAGLQVAIYFVLIELNQVAITNIVILIKELQVDV